MEQALHAGFVQSDELNIAALPDAILIEGVVVCLGGIHISVRKRVTFLDKSDDPLVKTTEYSYNVLLTGVGVVFRYDSPHIDHRQEHHVHRFDVLNGDSDGEVKLLFDENEIPVLAEVFEEAQDWFFDKLERLQELGIVPPDYPL